MDYVPFLIDVEVVHVVQIALLSNTGEKGLDIVFFIWAGKIKLVGVWLVEYMGKMSRVTVGVCCGT